MQALVRRKSLTEDIVSLNIGSLLPAECFTQE